jgi:signal transduction histidine kinase
VVISDWSSASVVVAPTYVLIVLPYSVARRASLPRALIALAALLVFGFGANVASKSAAGWYLGAPAMTGAFWGAGRWLQARALLHDQLARNAERIEAERASRISLALADERTRIARELHTLVASNVSAMVIQAEAAELLLDDDPRAADEAMAAVEQTGRDALSNMRRMLGVLHHSGDPTTLAPQPGVGELYALVEAARSKGQGIEMSVEGEPGPLPSSVDLAIFRVVEEALTAGGAGETLIRLWFNEDQIDLDVSVPHLDRSSAWPTPAMREWAAICNGSIRAEIGSRQQRLFTSLPRVLEEGFA